MNCRIESKEAFRIVGVSIPLAREQEQNFAIVPEFWDKKVDDGTLQRLAGWMDAQPMGLLGVCGCGIKEDWRYYIAVSSTKPAGDLEEYTVPAGTWAIFPGSGGSRAIQELECRAVAEWLPTSGYEYANGPDVEVYLNDDAEDARFEVWIPVKKK